MPEILPDVFLRVEFGTIGWQAQKADIGRGFKGFGGVPTSAVHDDDGMCATGDVTADFDKVGVHRMGVGMWHDQRRTHAACRTNRSKDIGTFISLIAHGAGPCAFLAPNIGERAFLTYAGFVLNPDFKAFANGVFGEDFRD